MGRLGNKIYYKGFVYRNNKVRKIPRKNKENLIKIKQEKIKFSLC